MNFLQHIQEIDKRIEERKEEEYQKTLFDFEDDAESLFSYGGLGITATGYTVPNPGGGVTYYSIPQPPKPRLPPPYKLPKVTGPKMPGVTYL